MILYPDCESAEVCTKCGQARHAAQFKAMPKNESGRDSVCRFCRDEEAKRKPDAGPTVPFSSIPPWQRDPRYYPKRRAEIRRLARAGR